MQCNVLRVCSLMLFLVALASCGGNRSAPSEIVTEDVVDDATDGVDEPGPLEALYEFELELPGVPERDGYIRKRGWFVVARANDGIRVGDMNVDGREYGVRGFLSFDLSGIPARAEILKAELVVEQYDWNGAPFRRLGDRLLVDHVRIDEGRSLTLDWEDYDAPAHALDIGTLSTGTAPGLRTLDVTRRVQVDVDAGRRTSDYRLRFERDFRMNGTDDRVDLNDAIGRFPAAERPTLLVRFRP